MSICNFIYLPFNIVLFHQFGYLSICLLIFLLHNKCEVSSNFIKFHQISSNFIKFHQPFILSMCCILQLQINMHFYQIAILSTCCFFNLQFMPNFCFVNLSYFQLVISSISPLSTCHFINRLNHLPYLKLPSHLGSYLFS